MPIQFSFCEAAFKVATAKTKEDVLLDAIESYCFFTLKAGVINPNTKRNMVISLTNFIVKAVDKFEKGQKEHGGNIQDRDLKHEITQETVDLFWYNEAQKWPSHLK